MKSFKIHMPILYIITVITSRRLRLVWYAAYMTSQFFTETGRGYESNFQGGMATKLRVNGDWIQLVPMKGVFWRWWWNFFFHKSAERLDYFNWPSSTDSSDPHWHNRINNIIRAVQSFSLCNWQQTVTTVVFCRKIKRPNHGTLSILFSWVYSVPTDEHRKASSMQLTI
jgi:hypothetical protein